MPVLVGIGTPRDLNVAINPFWTTVAPMRVGCLAAKGTGKGPSSLLMICDIAFVMASIVIKGWLSGSWGPACSETLSAATLNQSAAEAEEQGFFLFKAIVAGSAIPHLQTSRRHA